MQHCGTWGINAFAVSKKEIRFSYFTINEITQHAQIIDFPLNLSSYILIPTNYLDSSIYCNSCSYRYKELRLKTIVLVLA